MHLDTPESPLDPLAQRKADRGRLLRALNASLAFVLLLTVVFSAQSVARLATVRGDPADGGRAARRADRAAAARLDRAPRRERGLAAAARHPRRRRVSARHRARVAADLARLRPGRVAAGRSRHAPPRRQRPHPWPDVPGVRARPAAPRPRLDRRGDDRAVPLRRHAADDPAARARRVVAVAPGRRDGRRHRRVRVPAPGSAGAAQEIQLGNRGRTRRAGRARPSATSSNRASPRDVPVLWQRRQGIRHGAAVASARCFRPR